MTWMRSAKEDLESRSVCIPYATPMRLADLDRSRRPFYDPAQGFRSRLPAFTHLSQGLHPFMSRGRLRNILLGCSRLSVFVACVGLSTALLLELLDAFVER